MTVWKVDRNANIGAGYNANISRHLIHLRTVIV